MPIKLIIYSKNWRTQRIVQVKWLTKKKQTQNYLQLIEGLSSRKCDKNSSSAYCLAKGKKEHIHYNQSIKLEGIWIQKKKQADTSTDYSYYIICARSRKKALYIECIYCKQFGYCCVFFLRCLSIVCRAKSETLHITFTINLRNNLEVS